MSEHTPGPWVVGKGARWIIETEGGMPVAAAYTLSETAIRNANAALIAAAPDLLKALEEFLSSYGSIYRGDMDRAVKLGSAAIAKAKGETE